MYNDSRNGATSLKKPALIGVYALLVSAALLATDPSQAQTPQFRAAPTTESGVDASVLPGDDFFAFANAAWLKSTAYPTGKERVTAASEITEITRQQMQALIDDTNSAPAGSNARKVADFRTAYVDLAAIEAQGLTPVKPLLDSIARLSNKQALTRLLGGQLRADVDPLNQGIYNASHLLGLAVQPSIHGEKTYTAFLLQGGLGLPGREHYLGAEPRMQLLRAHYLTTIERMLALGGTKQAAKKQQRASAVLALETAIAQSHATHEASSNDRNADTVWSRADFAREAPGMDWQVFFAAAGLTKQAAFGAWQPSALRGAAALVATTPLQTWQDYLRVRVLHRYADVLPRAIAAEAASLRAALSNNPQSDRPQSSREQRALDAVQAALSNTLGKLYVQRHFPAEQRARVQAIVANVTAAFRQRVAATDWLSLESKAMAQAKLQAMVFGVGYPDVWPDDANLSISPKDAVGNQRRIADHNYRAALLRLGQPVDQRAWTVAPQWVGAVLTFHQNAYNFTAALLQAPKFDAAASDAMNYGAIGSIVGHEISHFVDTLGADYEADGHMRRWWSAADLTNYQAATAPLVAQFSSYAPLANLPVNGQATLVENLADLAGLQAAFDAYRRSLGSTAADKEHVRQQDRQFFIGYARSWRSKMTEAALRKYVSADHHAPEQYRVAAVRNLDAWYDAFDVQPGQKLYLDPKARLRVW